MYSQGKFDLELHKKKKDISRGKDGEGINLEAEKVMTRNVVYFALPYEPEGNEKVPNIKI